MAQGTGIAIVNMNEVLKDFKDYDKNTWKAFKKTMKRFAITTKKNQKNILKYKVRTNPNYYRKRGKGTFRQRWTGNLSGSINQKSVSKKAIIEFWIGPGQGTYSPIYAKFIEQGGQPYGNPNAAPFMGYQYVKNSIRGLKGTLGIALKRDIRNSTKK